jgi:Na+/proline symporter
MMVKRFWIFVALQLAITLGLILAVRALRGAGVSDGVSIAFGVAVAFSVFWFVANRMKKRDEQRVAAMPPAEAKREEARRLRIGLVGAVVGAALFGYLAVTAQTPQAFLMLALCVMFGVSVLRRIRKENEDPS